MQKPYRGDYKPDYEKWGIKKTSFFSCYLVILFLGFIVALIFDLKFFSSGFHIICLIISFIIYILNIKADDELEQKARNNAENEAEQRYQEDLDRYYHWLNSQDELSDRNLARKIKEKRALSQVDNEQLLGMYGQLQAIQNQTNQQAYLFYQEAQNALARGRTYELENSLDDLERALGI